MGLADEAEEGHGLVGFDAVLEARRQGARAFDFFDQEPDPVLFRQLRIVKVVILRPIVAEQQLGDRFTVAVGVLADIHRRQMEAEDTRLLDKTGKTTFCQPVAFVLAQAALNQLQVIDEFVGILVGPGIRPARLPGFPVLRQSRAQAPVNQDHFLAIRFKREAVQACDVALGGALQVLRQAGEKLLRKGAAGIGHAQMPVHADDGAAVEFQCLLILLTKRAPR